MDPVTAMYVAQGIHGLAYGMVLFLVASGLTLIFGMMGILNLAHASFFTQKNSSMLCIGINKIKIHFDTSQLCCGVVH